MSYLLDTDILAELRKPKGEAKVKAWFETVRAEQVFLSVLVVGEIQQGVERLASMQRGSRRSSGTTKRISCRLTAPWPRPGGG